MKWHLGCKLVYNVLEPSTFIFNIRPYNNSYQTIVEESLKISPALKVEEFGSDITRENRYFRLAVAPGKLAIDYQATIDSHPRILSAGEIPETPANLLPREVFPYVLPSRYCQSDKLGQFAKSEFGDLLPGYSRVQGICNWIYEKVIYLSGSTNSQTSAYDTVTQRAGVCRDFAHLGIALCRALNIPARFVGGYAYGLNPPDFHAYFEAYLDGQWYLFDATRLMPLTGTVRIGSGRDASDVSFATIFGSLVMEEMKLFVEPVGQDSANLLIPTTNPITTC